MFFFSFFSSFYFFYFLLLLYFVDQHPRTLPIKAAAVMALSKGSVPPSVEKKSIIPLFIKAELVPDDCNVVNLCEACERVSGHGSIDGATLVNRLWRILPFNEVSRAKLLSNGVNLFGKQLKLEGKNPFLHASGDGECQTTRLIIKNLPFSYCQSAVARNLIKAGFKLRGSLQWMKGRNRRTGRLSDFRDGRRSVFIDVPQGNVNRIMQMGSFRATLYYPEMAVRCFRCLQEGHTAKECSNQEICHRCKKPGHRREHCTFDHERDVDSDSEGEEASGSQDHPSGRSDPPSKPPVSEGAPSGTSQTDCSTEVNGNSQSDKALYSSVVKGNPGTSSQSPGKESPRGLPGAAPLVATSGLADKDGSKGPDSPMTDFIDSVEFAKLPGSDKQAQGLSSLTSRGATSTQVSSHSKSSSAVEDTPKKRVDTHATYLKTPHAPSGEIASIWEPSTEHEQKELSLLLEASALAEANSRQGANDVVTTPHGSSISGNTSEVPAVELSEDTSPSEDRPALDPFCRYRQSRGPRRVSQPILRAKRQSLPHSGK